MEKFSYDSLQFRFCELLRGASVTVVTERCSKDVTPDESGPPRGKRRSAAGRERFTSGDDWHPAARSSERSEASHT